MCIILLKYLKFENEHEKMDYFLVYSAALIFHLAFHPVQPAVQRRRSKNTSANTRKVARRSTTVATLDNDAPAEDTTIDPIILADPLLRKDFKFKRGYYFIHNINPKPIYVSEIIHTISQFDEKQGRTSETFDTPHFNISIPANGTSRKLDFDYQSLRSGSDRWTATVEYDNREYEVQSLKCTLYDVDSNLVNVTIDISKQQFIVNRSYSGSCVAKLMRLFKVDQFVDIPTTSTTEKLYGQEESYEGPDMTEGEPPYVPDYLEND